MILGNAAFSLYPPSYRLEPAVIATDSSAAWSLFDLDQMRFLEQLRSLESMCNGHSFNWVIRGKWCELFPHINCIIRSHFPRQKYVKVCHNQLSI